MKKDKKPNLTRFKAFQQIMVEAAERADSLGDLQGAGWCYEQAVNSVEYLMARNPTDMALRDQQRDLSGRLTIVKGKYGNAETFRESLRDGDKQKILHDSERAKQGESTLETLITAGRRELAEHPTVPGKINALAEALLKSDRQDHEDEAVALLLKAATDLQNYSFKVRADDIRLRSLARRARDLTDRAKTSGAEEDRQQARLAAMEQLETELDVYRERVEKYPTDLRIRFKLGAAMFRARHFDEAIPVLQAASGDPRSRSQCRLLIGRSFLEKGNHVQATEVLREALAEHELPGDDVGKELTYWLARAYEAAGRADEARAAYGNLLRQDYNYAGGEARRRMEQLAPSA
jgi:tetratricopeptide (TPR) repeat protein